MDNTHFDRNAAIAELTNTNLVNKHFSPFFIRKYNIINGWPLYVSMICDADVSDLDKVVNEVINLCKEKGKISDNLQDIRNITGILSEALTEHYNQKKENCVEGVAITIYVDKAYIQSLYGDFMNHLSCRLEYMMALNILPHV